MIVLLARGGGTVNALVWSSYILGLLHGTHSIICIIGARSCLLSFNSSNSLHSWLTAPIVYISLCAGTFQYVPITRSFQLPAEADWPLAKRRQLIIIRLQLSKRQWYKFQWGGSVAPSSPIKWRDSSVLRILSRFLEWELKVNKSTYRLRKIIWCSCCWHPASLLDFPYYREIAKM